MTFKEMLDRAKEFYDTIDFEPFLKKCVVSKHEIPVDDLCDELEKYYDEEHPELLPEDFRGYFFNYVNQEEFVDYIKDRYNLISNEVVTTHYYLYGAKL